MRNCLLIGCALFSFFLSRAQRGDHDSPVTAGLGLHPVKRQVAPVARVFDIPVSGPWIEWTSGQKLFSVTGKHGLLHGCWQSWYAKGHVCDSGYLLNNIPSGEWKFWDEEGRLIAIRNYDAEKYSRVADAVKRYHPRSNFYRISEMAQKEPARADYYLSSTYSFPSERKPGFFQTLKSLVIHNISNPGQYTPVFNKCLHEGLYMNFFTNGQSRDSGIFHNGLPNGLWLHRENEGGNFWLGEYRDGLRNREWKQYNEFGELRELWNYRNGKLRWKKSFPR